MKYRLLLKYQIFAFLRIDLQPCPSPQNFRWQQAVGLTML